MLIDDDRVRYALNAKKFGGHADVGRVGRIVDPDPAGDRVINQKPAYRRFVLACEGDEDNRVVLTFLSHCIHMGYGRDTGTAPSGPEFHDNEFTVKMSEVRNRALRCLKNPLKVQVHEVHVGQRIRRQLRRRLLPGGAIASCRQGDYEHRNGCKSKSHLASIPRGGLTSILLRAGVDNTIIPV